MADSLQASERMASDIGTRAWDDISRRPDIHKAKSRQLTRVTAAGGFVLWVATLALGALTLAPVGKFAVSEAAGEALLHADDATIRQTLSQSWPITATANYYETLSELAIAVSPADIDAAYLAAERAVARDASRPFAWAGLAYLETRRSGTVTPKAIEALTRSMDACPLCGHELIRWRFNFVLSNWSAIPEALRVRAFEHADLLRWSGANAEFLAEMRAKALAMRIPYDAYRAKIDTPVRAWDIGPKPVALRGLVSNG